MAVLHNYYCPDCDEEFREVWSDTPPRCCGKEARILIVSVNHWEWGGPRTYTHLRDEPFESRSELNDYARKNNMSLGESSEKVGGARNDEYENTGKIFSGKGMSRKQNKLYSEGVRRS